MNKYTIVVHGVTTTRELATANDLMARAQLPSYSESMRWLRRTGPNWPGNKLEHTRAAFDGGEMIGALRILTLTLRIGKARLVAGGIGWVSTRASHRNRGVCRCLMDDALSYMARTGYHVSVLFGIPNLYHKFGYVTAIPNHSVIVELSDLPSSANAARVRHARWSDAASLRRAHDKDEGSVACSVVRSAQYFDTLFHCTEPTIPFWPDWKSTMVVLDARSRAAGYLMPQQGGETLHIKELAVTGPEHHNAMLNAAVSLARKSGARKLRFHVPAVHPFALYLREFNSVHETRHVRNSEGMMALVNAGEALHRMLPEWRERVRESRLATTRAALTLIVDSAPYTISADRGEVSIKKNEGMAGVSLTAQELCRLISGHTSGHELFAISPRRATDEQRRMLDVLFPARTPYVWPIDHF